MISVAGLLLLFFLISDNELTYQEASIRLVEELVPSAIVALLAFPLLLLLLRRKGILNHQDNSIESRGDAKEVPPKVTHSVGEYGWSGTISWEEVCNAVGRLSTKIMDDGYSFDCIVSLTDGGLIVADLLLFHRKFRAKADLQTPVVCMNLVRRLEPTKVVEVFTESYPIEYARRFERLLIVDEASRSGKTMDAVVAALNVVYENNHLPLPSYRIATLGVLVDGGPYTDYSEIRLSSGQAYPWGPFAEHWRAAH
jgi:hypoxanthine phosphoribosyltransferase